MTIVRHDALGQPGESHLGHELDCPKCFAALGDAFRVPALPPETPAWDGQHDTHAYALPYDGLPGGIWQATCTCGWSKAGPYARDGVGERVALRLAQSWADRHRASPLEDDPEARPHLMVPPDNTRTLDLNPVHTVRYVALNDVAVGVPEQGMWEAACTCGWQTGGRWGGPADDIHDFTHARIHAKAEAEAHLAKKEDQ